VFSLSQKSESILAAARERMTRCVAMAHYHTAADVEVVYRDLATDSGAKPEVLAQQARNYLEGRHNTLERFIYCNVNVADRDGGMQKALDILQNGTRIDKLGHWHAYAWWMQDKEAAFILTEDAGSSTTLSSSGKLLPATTFDKLGIICKFTGRSDANKASKYLKRLLANYNQGMWFGDVIQRGRGCIAVRMDNGVGLNFIVRGVRLDRNGRSVDDGEQYLTVSAYKALTGRRVKPGSGFQITALEASGLIKGHVQILDDNDLPVGVDGIFIGPKKQVKALGDRFTIGFLQELHAAEEFYTDLQSVINFKLWKFLADWAPAQMQQYYANLKDGAAIDASIERMLEKQHVDHAWWEESYLPAQIYLAEQKYHLGLSANLIPSAAYRLGRMTEKQIDQMCMRDPEGKLRVLVPDDVAFARYAIVDKTAMDFDGNIDEDSGVLAKGQAFVGGKIGEYVLQMKARGEKVYIWVHRQPNGHPGERFKLELIWSEGMEDIFGDGPYIHVSAATIGEMMEILGGGDQDDRLGCYFAKHVVDHISALPAYPKPGPEASPAAAVSCGSTNPAEAAPVKQLVRESFVAKLDKGYTFNRELMARIIIAKANERLSIGSAVTPLMIYNALWHEGRITDKIYDFSHVGWKLEQIIDALVKDGSNIEWVTEARKSFYQSVEFMPCWARRKVSRELWDRQQFRTVETELDRELAWLEGEADEYQKFLVRHTHYLVLQTWSEVGFMPQRYMSSHFFHRDSPGFRLARNIQAVYADLLDRCRLHMIGRALDGGIARLEAEKVLLRKGEPMRLQKLFWADDLAAQKARPEVAKLWNDPAIIGLTYQMAERMVYELYHDDKHILEAFVVLWQQTYRKATDNPAYKLSDGLLWGRYTASLTIQALVWARDNMPDGPKMFTPKDAAEPVEAIMASTLEAPAAVATTEVVAASAFTDLPGFFRVVNGNFAKVTGCEMTDTQVSAWKKKLDGKEYDLVPVWYKGRKAYSVQSNGNLKAWLDEQDAWTLWEASSGEQVRAKLSYLPGHPYMMKAELV
jgi:hypothetical protein